MNNLLLITGAGASYDVVDPALIPVNREYRPPLTRNLFFPKASFSGPDYYKGPIINEGFYANECIQKYPIAAKIGYAFKMKMESGREEENLESYLYDIKNDERILIKSQFWSVPLYLYDLFTAVSQFYIPSSTHKPISTNYKLLIEEISHSNYDQTVWLNLNYDLLADFAIRSSVTREINNFADYMRLETQDGLKIKYTKPHGSVDWFRTIDNVGCSYPITRKLISDEPTKIPVNFENRLSRQLFTQKELKDERLRNDLSYPAILAPLGKYNYVCVEHINEIKKDLKETTSALCIGFKALDENMLDLVNENIPNISKLKIVNGKFSAKSIPSVFDRISSHCKKTKIEVKKEDAQFNGGFSDFIKGGIREWLNL